MFVCDWPPLVDSIMCLGTIVPPATVMFLATVALLTPVATVVAVVIEFTVLTTCCCPPELDGAEDDGGGCNVEVIGMIVVVCLFKATLAFANFCALPALCIGSVLLVIVMDIDECATDGATVEVALDVRTLMLGFAAEDNGTSSSCLPISCGAATEAPP